MLHRSVLVTVVGVQFTDIWELRSCSPLFKYILHTFKLEAADFLKTYVTFLSTYTASHPRKVFRASLFVT